jgi:hypothetical protein
MNTLMFFKAVNALKELPCGQFSKRQFEQVASRHLVGMSSASSVFENLRDMGLVTKVREEDCSTILDSRWGDEQNITFEQYQALPQCVLNALDWYVCPRVRYWYVVNHLAIAQEIANRKAELSKEFDLLNSL